MTTPPPGAMSPYRFPPHLDLYTKEEIMVKSRGVV